MSNTDTHKPDPRHLRVTEPSPWVARWAHLVKPGGRVLDVAAGGGRHGRLFLELSCAVTFVDKTVEPLTDLAAHAQATIVEADLEDGGPWPFAGQTFDALVVVNYLYRPLFCALLDSLKPGGVLIYETFARGNEDYARPRNPDHLLKSGELLELAAGKLNVVAYEHGRVEGADISGVKQRLCAVRDLGMSDREDGEPQAHVISRV